MEVLELVELIDVEKAFSLLGEDAEVFKDGGDEPDGNGYLYPAESFLQGVVEKMVRTGAARVVEGCAEIYPRGYWEVAPREAKVWCGYQECREVFWY